MAYAAVISLKHTINGLVNSSPISPLSSTQEILEIAYNQTISLQQVLGRLSNSISSSSRERLDALDGQIRDCAHKLEDVLEIYELNQLSSYENEGDLEKVMQEITFFVGTAKKMEKDYIEESSRPLTEEEEEDDDDAIVSSTIDFGVAMVGHSSLFNSIRDRLLHRMRPDDKYIFSFLGEVGSGRTMVAKTIFEDLRQGREQIFDCCAWVTIGMEFQLKEVLIRIIVQVYDVAPRYYGYLFSREDEKLCKYLYTILEHQRYMIVLDDVHDEQLVHYLSGSLPDQSNGSLVILTTSLKEVAQLGHSLENFEVAASPFVQEVLWVFLRRLFFIYESIAPELEKAGKKIIENCRPHNISFIKILLYLNKTDVTVEHWNQIAEDKENPIFMVADEISEVSKIKTEIQSFYYIMDSDICEAKYGWISGFIDDHETVEDIKKKIHPERYFLKMEIISLLGMAGIGKSMLARKFFKDESILRHFDHHVWVTLGPKYQSKEILIDILAQIYPDIDILQVKEDEKLARELCGQLCHKRCLIVLDDIWSKKPLHHMKNLFPDIKGTTLVTTRLTKVTKFGRDDSNFEMQLLDEEESWCLLRQKVFVEGLCPPQLEKAGRKIAENCEGLPLLILTVANQLLKVEMSEESWNNIVSGKQKSVFKNAHDEISKGLLPSYQSLPQHLKSCFLYMGVFRVKYKIPTSKLTNLLIAEEFLQPDLSQMVEDFVAECLFELLERSLIMVQRKVSNSQFKTCNLHSVFWHLANSQAVKNKFFYAMNSYDDCSIESIESQRRLCIRNSILLGLKDVQNSMASNKSAHSLLCVSPLQQYPVCLNFDMRLLRVMDALTIRLYEFPLEVVRLVQLRYLGLTCNGKLPTSISNLWKLQYLIVKRYMTVKSSEDSWALPEEIWDMKDLKHLQVMGGCLPDHKAGPGLLNLSALLDVSAQSCREEVLQWIPNLKRLGIRIELAPNDEGNSFHYLNNIYHLSGLESLKCVVVNPQIRAEIVPPPAPVSMFPSSLEKLSLSGLGYPWEYMSILGKLENLEVLKLKRYAFQGPKWEMDHTSSFDRLKFLLIEDTNLVHWKSSLAMIELQRLCFKHCYKIQEIPIVLANNIEIVDCNPLILTLVDQIGELETASPPKVHLSWIAPTKNGSQ